MALPEIRENLLEILYFVSYTASSAASEAGTRAVQWLRKPELGLVPASEGRCHSRCPASERILSNSKAKQWR